MLWPNPVLAVGPVMVAAAESPVPASSPVREPDGDSVRAKSEPEPVPPAPAPVIDLRLMGALLIVALVLAGIIGRLTYLPRPPHATRPARAKRPAAACAAPSIMQILVKAPSPSYRDQVVPESTREGITGLGRSQSMPSSNSIRTGIMPSRSIHLSNSSCCFKRSISAPTGPLPRGKSR
jgi:hypothetical protein